MHINKLRTLKYLMGVCLLAILLSACGNRFEEQLNATHQEAQSSLSHLKNQLDSRQLINSLLIDKYARALSQQKPDYADVAGLLKKEATSQGKAYNALDQRLGAVNLLPNSSEEADRGLQELQLIHSAADVQEFNNSLADVVNTLASLSDGQLAVINVPASQRASAQQSNALVGNPAYGNWRQDSNGQSLWAWYGMYSMFNNVFGRPYYYNSWSSRPHYSYYGNYGRNRWGSNNDVSRNRDLSRRHPSRYNKPTVASKRRYATTTRRSSSYGGAASKSTSKSSRYSSYGSSSRSSSFSSSRGFRSGK